MQTTRADVIFVFEAVLSAKSNAYKRDVVEFYLYEDTSPLQDLQKFKVVESDYSDIDTLLNRLIAYLKEQEQLSRELDEHIRQNKELIEQDYQKFLDDLPEKLRAYNLENG